MQKSKHLNEMGFMLIETLLVSLTVASILIYMYIQFSGINDSYRRVKTYNTVEAQYRAEVVKHFLMLNTSVNQPLTEQMDTAYYPFNAKYLVKTIGSCVGDATTALGTNATQRGANRISYFCRLVSKLDVNYIILAKGDVQFRSYPPEMQERLGLKSFMKQIDFSEANADEYRIIVEFKDGAFASVLYTPYGEM